MASLKWLLGPGSLCVVALAPGTRAPPEYTVLVGTVGVDTIAVDRFLRDDTKLEGVLLIREPYTHTMHYMGTFAPEGRFALMEITWRDAAGNEMRTAKITFGVDSIRSEIRNTPIESTSAPPELDAIPLPPKPYARHAYSLLEHAAIVTRLSAMRDEGVMPWIVVGSAKTDSLRTRRLGADTYEIDFIGGTVRLQVREDGRLESMTGTIDSVAFSVRRAAADVDLAGLTASFASRDTLPPGAPR